MIDQNIFQDLIEKGFRRSGQYIYKPSCKGCTACIPIRLTVQKFLSSRSQKRIFKKHQHFNVREVSLAFKQEHFDLYSKYQNKRHSSINNDQNNIDDYNDFLIKSNVNSKLVEFWDGDILKIVSIIDMMSDGISAVYTFFDTDFQADGLGTYSILKQIELCQRRSIDHLYLGYYIADSPHMNYKSRFLPNQRLIDGRWTSFHSKKK